jgi:hypothetical protein
MKKIYLACPYSHKEKIVRQKRFLIINKIAADLMNAGNLVFSPISHTHPIALAGNLPLGWDFWHEYDKTFLEWCDEIYVAKLNGWETSVGVKAEIEIARKLCKPIHYLDVRS